VCLCVCVCVCVCVCNASFDYFIFMWFIQMAALDLKFIVVPEISSNYWGAYPSMTDERVAVLLGAVWAVLRL
jgi:hypothetical protein